MGVRGPVPKRSDQRRRRNKPGIDIDMVGGAAVAVPDLDVDVHPLVAAWYGALAEGAEARYYTSALWQRARIVAVMLSRLLTASGRPSAQMYAALQNDMKALLVDAGELRRLGIEVQAAEESGDADVIDYRARATAGG